MTNILIGGAWPYANGSPHIGHIASLLPGDVLARYYRAKGENVFYVSGSDCHGTPITIRALQENRTPAEISEQYHKEFLYCFNKLGFSYDLYTKTSDAAHIEFVKNFHKKLYKSDYIEERTISQAYCPKCKKVLTERLVIGKCPSCGSTTRADQCDVCGEILEAYTVISPKCAQCGTSPIFGETTQLFLLITKLRKELLELLESHTNWRKNAVAFTKRYIDEGLRDRAITRDLDWGIDVPKSGYENKKIYIWAENVLGYLSASYNVCLERGTDFRELFGENARHYYVHGKDNIPFHTIILPSLLLAEGEGFRLPDDIISSEYVTLDGEKISTSKNHAIWAKDLAENYNPDSVRYFFIAKGPEKRDADFSWNEFKKQNNSELVGVWGNFVNRTLVFIKKYFGNKIPNGNTDTILTEKISAVFDECGQKIENGFFRDALKLIFNLAKYGNKYYDSNTPWITRTENPKKCADTIFNCTYLIANISVLLKPFLPFSSDKIINLLEISEQWKEQKIKQNLYLPDFSILFSRIDTEK